MTVVGCCQLCQCDPCKCSACVSCGCDPCGCQNQVRFDGLVNPNHNTCTVCTGDKNNNMWFIPGPPGFPGKCKLDELTFCEVAWVLAKNPHAKKDLLRITDDECLLKLANTVNLIVPPCEEILALQKRLSDRIPYYTFFKGNKGGGF